MNEGTTLPVTSPVMVDIAPPTAAGVVCIGYAPITRVDAARREVELCATSEAVDSHGTVFDYDASKDAFTRWIGNVREMHVSLAVGSRVALRCDDETRRVFVRVRISRGAAETWEKVLDGTLRGASIGASNVIWERQRRTVAGEARLLPVATRYDLVELSLVDNPSNPDTLGLTIVRDAVPDIAVLDALLDVPPDELTPERARVKALLEPSPAIDRMHEAARAVLVGCGCPACVGALAALDEPVGEPDGARRAQEWDATQRSRVARMLATELRAGTTRLDRLDESLRALQTALRDLPGAVGDMRLRLDALEAQPVSGGPAVFPTVHPTVHAAEKTHALAPAVSRAGGEPDVAEHVRALEALAGRLRDPQAQIAVAAELIRLRQGE